MDDARPELFQDIPRLKRCPDCGESKPLEDFPRNRSTYDGRAVYCKPCHNARGRATVERLYGSTRHYHLMRRYGIGAADFDRMLEEQDGACAICGRADPEHVDHSHATGDVRGILCFNCNGGLGQFRDSAGTLRAAAAYLDERDPDVRALVAMVEARAGELRAAPV